MAKTAEEMQAEQDAAAIAAAEVAATEAAEATEAARLKAEEEAGAKGADADLKAQAAAALQQERDELKTQIEAQEAELEEFRKVGLTETEALEDERDSLAEEVQTLKVKLTTIEVKEARAEALKKFPNCPPAALASLSDPKVIASTAEATHAEIEEKKESEWGGALGASTTVPTEAERDQQIEEAKKKGDAGSVIATLLKAPKRILSPKE